jgi:predicted ArsR family transcriptional regulator
MGFVEPGTGSETDALAALAVLNEPLRRRVYEHVATSPSGEVSRDGAAAALRVPRSVAVFHLDKLVDAGLLEVRYRRPPGRGGPGAGRPAKWYRRAPGEISVSVPERHYGLAAELLARAVERAGEGASDLDIGDLLADVARAYGHDLASELGSSPTGASASEARPALLEHLVGLLAHHGYEPRVSGGVITMANCPFHALAEEHRDLVCHMNHDLLSGVAEKAGLPPEAARLDPEPGRCCVTIVA